MNQVNISLAESKLFFFFLKDVSFKSTMVVPFSLQKKNPFTFLKKRGEESGR